MSREEFIAMIEAKKQETDPAWTFESEDLIALPCDCGEEGCPGWRIGGEEEVSE